MDESKKVSELVSDPVLCRKLIGTHTSVKLNSNKQAQDVCGYLSAFDPVSGMIILQISGEKRLIMPDHIASLKFDSNDTIKIENIESNLTTSNLSEEKVKETRDRVLKIISEAQLSAKLLKDCSIEVASVAVINPPFTARDIVTTNSVIRNRLSELIKE